MDLIDSHDSLQSYNNPSDPSEVDSSSESDTDENSKTEKNPFYDEDLELHQTLQSKIIVPESTAIVIQEESEEDETDNNNFPGPSNSNLHQKNTQNASSASSKNTTPVSNTKIPDFAYSQNISSPTSEDETPPLENRINLNAVTQQSKPKNSSSYNANLPASSDQTRQKNFFDSDVDLDDLNGIGDFPKSTSKKSSSMGPHGENNDSQHHSQNPGKSSSSKSKLSGPSFSLNSGLLGQASSSKASSSKDKILSLKNSKQSLTSKLIPQEVLLKQKEKCKKIENKLDNIPLPSNLLQNSSSSCPSFSSTSSASNSISVGPIVTTFGAKVPVKKEPESEDKTDESPSHKPPLE